MAKERPLTAATIPKPDKAPITHAVDAMRVFDCNYVKLVIGNTFKKIPDEKTELSLGGVSKTLGWTLYVDAIGGDPRIIQAISVVMKWGQNGSPNGYYKRNRWRRISAPDGMPRWRCFQSTQSTWGLIDVAVEITGVGTENVTQSYTLRDYNHEAPPFHFVEPNLSQDTTRKPLPVPEYLNFRLEFSTDDGVHEVGPRVKPEDRQDDIDSNVCGEDGIDKCGDRMRDLPAGRTSPSIRVDTKGFSQEKLKRVCQNAVKYEDAIVFLIRKSCQPMGVLQSNKSVIVSGESNAARHQRIGSCRTALELKDCLNPKRSSRYRLQLQYNELTQTITSIVFAFDTQTRDVALVEHLVRFCIRFVHGSTYTRGLGPTHFKEDKTMPEQLAMLFDLIDDGVIEDCLLDRNIVAGQVQEMDDDTMKTLSSIELSDAVSSDSQSLLDFASLAVPYEYCFEKHISSAGVQETESGQKHNLVNKSHAEPKRPRIGTRSDHPPPDPDGTMGLQELAAACDSSVKLACSAMHRKSDGPSPHIDEEDETPRDIKLLHRGNLKDDKKISAKTLNHILKQLNLGRPREKAQRISNIENYLRARETEIAHHGHSQEVAPDPGASVGIQVVGGDNGTGQYEVFLPRGMKLLRKSGSTHQARAHEATVTESTLDDLSRILRLLGKPSSNDMYGCTATLDNYLMKEVSLSMLVHHDKPSASVNDASTETIESTSTCVLCFSWAPPVTETAL